MSAFTPTANFHLAVISQDFELRSKFMRNLADPRVTFHGFATLEEFRAYGARRAPMSALAVDLETTLRSSMAEKEFLRDLQKRLPTLEFVGIPEVPAWQKFLVPLLAQSLAEGRRHPRRLRILRASVWNSAGSDQLRCFTADLSAGGCFVVSTSDMVPGTELRLQLSDLPEPLTGRVVWARNWDSVQDEFPGFGVEFQPCSPETRVRLDQLIHEANSPGT